MKYANIKYRTVEIECRICKGTGYIYTDTINTYGEKIVRRYRCENCNGKGCIVRSIGFTQKDFRM